MKNTNDEIWLINPTSKTYTYQSDSWNKFVDFPPGRPVLFPKYEAMYPLKSGILRECRNPDDYFKEKNFRVLIIRDQGLGDCLLLEPVIREYKRLMRVHIDIATMFPDIYLNHPDIDNVIMMKTPSDNSAYNAGDYDRVVELRMWSERAESSGKKHRTQVYNEKFGNMRISPEDLEPRLYVGDGEKNEIFVRRPGKTYIGIQTDATETRRRYEKGRELIETIMGDGSIEPVIIVFGTRKMVDCRKLGRNVIDLQGKTTLRQTILAIRDLDGLIATDSGLAHVAMTFHVPTTTLYSIVPHELRDAYYRGPKSSVEKDIPCIRCCNKGGPRCDTGKPIPCMDIPPSTLHESLKGTIKKADDVLNDKKTVAMAGIEQAAAVNGGV